MMRKLASYKSTFARISGPSSCSQAFAHPRLTVVKDGRAVTGTAGYVGGLSAPEIAALARHANARVTLAVYGGLTDEGREQAAAKLIEGGFGR
jgi:hypothetical protein